MRRCPATQTVPSMTATTARISQLQERSRQLRARARVLEPVVAETYRRRAAELDALAALLDAVWNAPDPDAVPANTCPSERRPRRAAPHPHLTAGVPGATR